MKARLSACPVDELLDPARYAGLCSLFAERGHRSRPRERAELRALTRLSEVIDFGATGRKRQREGDH